MLPKIDHRTGLFWGDFGCHPRDQEALVAKTASSTFQVPAPGFHILVTLAEQPHMPPTNTTLWNNKVHTAKLLTIVLMGGISPVWCVLIIQSNVESINWLINFWSNFISFLQSMIFAIFFPEVRPTSDTMHQGVKRKDASAGSRILNLAPKVCSWDDLLGE